jgi:PGAP1-like protein
MKIRTLALHTFAAICGLVGLAPNAEAQVNFGLPFPLGINRPRLVVLIHGVTPKPTENPEQKIGHPAHARHYWGFDFIKGLQGRTDETKMIVYTPMQNGLLRAYNTDAAAWTPSNSDSTHIDYAPICFPVSGWGTIPPGMEHNQPLLRSNISLMTNPQAATAQYTMVMINTRDGSKHLMPQLAETINEIYNSYKVAFGVLPENRQPQIYLVGHSFGGVIARALLANPTAGDLWGNKLTATERLKADYLRKRVVLVCTLASPHEGTHIGDPAGDVADYIAQAGPSALASYFATYNFWAPEGKKYTNEQVKAKSKEAMQTALNAVSGKRDCLQDLRRMNEYNTGILKPNVERRWANGPLVPIYTAAGRNPGGRCFDQERSIFILGGDAFNPISTIDLFKNGTRHSSEASALNLIGGVMHIWGYGREGRRPWGTAETSDGDRVADAHRGIGPAAARPYSAGWAPSPALGGVAGMFVYGHPYLQNTSDGEWDNDGFLGWDSAHAYHLTGSNFYRIYKSAEEGAMLPWDVDHHGSIMFNPANGAWVHNELIREAGSEVSPGDRRSVWGPLGFPETPSNGVKVEVLQVKDPFGNLDTGSGADFRLSVRIDGTETTDDLPEGDNLEGNMDYSKTNIASSIIPIRIKVIERDNPTPDPHDICIVSPQKGQSSLYLFYDVRTNRIMGDQNAMGGDVMWVNPAWSGVENKVQLKIRITPMSVQ